MFRTHGRVRLHGRITHRVLSCHPFAFAFAKLAQFQTIMDAVESHVDCELNKK
jgi:hypothetical protein